MQAMTKMIESMLSRPYDLPYIFKPIPQCRAKLMQIDAMLDSASMASLYSLLQHSISEPSITHASLVPNPEIGYGYEFAHEI